MKSKSKINWKELLYGRCPLCGISLVQTRTNDNDIVYTHKSNICTFSIGIDRFEEIKYNIMNKVDVTGKRRFEEGYGD